MCSQNRPVGIPGVVTGAPASDQENYTDEQRFRLPVFTLFFSFSAVSCSMTIKTHALAFVAEGGLGRGHSGPRQCPAPETTSRDELGGDCS